jgi:DNA-binding response OmpR family regulator
MERQLENSWGYKRMITIRKMSDDDILNSQRNIMFMLSLACSVDRFVTTLRNKIEPDANNPIFIHTLREIGYKFSD